MRQLFVPVVLLAAFAAGNAQAMKPGLWEVTTQMSGDNMPKMPALSEAQRRQMEARGIRMPAGADGAMRVAVKHCVTKEQAERRTPPQSDQDARNRCEQKDVKQSGNTVTWKVECSGERKMSGSGSMTFQGEEGYTGESVFTMQDPKRGPMTMRQNYSGKWLGAACK